MKKQTISILGAGVLLLSGYLLSPAQETPRTEEAGQAGVEHPECSLFFNRDKFNQPGGNSASNEQGRMGALTQQVVRMLSFAPEASHIQSFEDQTKFGTIDKYL